MPRFPRCCGLCGLAALLLFLPDTKALDNGAASTPPLGFMSWNSFRCAVSPSACAAHACVSAELLETMADALVATGLAGAGFTIVALDDCWAARERSEDGRLVADTTRFPDGLAGVAAAITARGLRVGIYTDLGPKTCAGYPGSRDHFETDASLFASINASYVKADGCGVEADDLEDAYVEFGRALAEATRRAGRPAITFSCSWPAYLPVPPAAVPYASLIAHCNTWRKTVDVDTSVGSVVAIARWFAAAARSSRSFASAPRPGAWHDPDQLLLGDDAIPWSVQALQYAVWATTAAPLFLSADVRTMDSPSIALASHPTIIAINQDVGGAPSHLLLGGGGHGGSVAVVAWARRVSGGRAAAVVIANTTPTRRRARVRVPMSVLVHLPADACWREIDLTREGVAARREWVVPQQSARGRAASIDLPPLTARLFMVEKCTVEEETSSTE